MKCPDVVFCDGVGGEGSEKYDSGDRFFFFAYVFREVGEPASSEWHIFALPRADGFSENSGGGRGDEIFFNFRKHRFLSGEDLRVSRDGILPIANVWEFRVVR